MLLRIATVLIAAFAAQEGGSEDPASLIEKLRSDRAEQREEAARKLAGLGKAAAPALEKAAKDADAEVASQARQLLRRLAVRDMLPAILRQTIPGVEERLVTGGDRAWTELFLEVGEKAGGLYSPNVLERLAVPAIRGAASDGDLEKAIRVAVQWNVRSAVPEVTRLLQDKRESIRRVSVRALGELKVGDALAGVLAVLGDGSPDVRQAALYSLADLDARDAAPKILPRLQDDDADVRATAADVLARLRHRPAVPGIVALLKHPATHIRQTAVQALSGMDAVEAVPDLLPLLRDPQSNIRTNSIWTLQALNAREAIPEFIRLLEDPEDLVRGSAASALGWLGVRAEIPKIRALLKDKAPYARTNAIYALGQLDDKEALGEIIQLLHQDVASCVGGRAESMAKILRNLGAAAATAEFLKLLKSDNPGIRSNAIGMLAAMEAGEAVPELRKMLRDPAAWVRTTAIRAMEQLKVREAIPDIQALLKDREGGVHIAAVQALGELGAKESMQSLEALLADDVSSVRYWTLQALRDLDARESIPKMIQRLRDSDALVRQNAAKMLGQMNAREAIPELIKGVADDGMRSHALDALDWLEAGEAIPEVAALLKHSYCSTRVQAASWLCGRGAREGAPMLIEESRDLTALNALRRPELWRKLRRTPWTLSRHRSSKDLPGFLAKEWGLALETPAGAKEWVRVSTQTPREPSTVLELLRGDALQERLQLIVEKDRIRLVPYDDALAFWKAWLSELK